jgi:hypothetical protein
MGRSIALRKRRRSAMGSTRGSATLPRSATTTITNAVTAIGMTHQMSADTRAAPSFGDAGSVPGVRGPCDATTPGSQPLDRRFANRWKA